MRISCKNSLLWLATVLIFICSTVSATDDTRPPNGFLRGLQEDVDVLGVAGGYTEFVGESLSECIADNGLASVILCPSIVAFETTLVGVGAILLLVLQLTGGGF